MLFLRKSGLIRQKMVVIAQQRDEYLRAKFKIDVSLYKPEMLVFLDETGADRRNATRKHGYSVRGRPATSYKLLVRGQHVSTIPSCQQRSYLTANLYRDLLTEMCSMTSFIPIY